VRGWIEHPGQPLRGWGGIKKDPPPDEPTDHALGRSRGGWGSKLHLAVDGQGIPLAAEVSPGQAHESKWFEEVMNAVRIRQPLGSARRRPKRVAGDKGYSYPRIRQWLRERGIKAVIPRRSNERRRGNETFDRESYRRRNVVERCVNWLKEARRIGTRYEKLAVNFLAMVKLAIIRRYFRLLDSSDRP